MPLCNCNNRVAIQPLASSGLCPLCSPGNPSSAKENGNATLHSAYNFSFNAIQASFPLMQVPLPNIWGPGSFVESDLASQNALSQFLATIPSKLSIVSRKNYAMCRASGPKRKEKIISTWAEQRVVRDVMIFLQKYGITPTYSQKIFREYGQESIAKLNDDPYCLARDVHGIGFKSADQIARKMGIERNDPKRLEAGIRFCPSRTLARWPHLLPCRGIPPHRLDAPRSRGNTSCNTSQSFARNETSGGASTRAVPRRGPPYLATALV